MGYWLHCWYNNPEEMANADDFQINNLLCFINSAKKDYPNETLKDVTYAFYSHEEIKSAKTLLCNLLKKRYFMAA